MEGRILKVLELYRDNMDPELTECRGKCLSTFSKEECLNELKTLKVDGLKLCRIGGIDPAPEFLCRILHHAMKVDTSEKESEKAKEAGPSPKKAKTDTTTMKGMAEKLKQLEKQLEERKNKDELSEFERAKQDVKDEAVKAEQVNVELLHEKLTRLETVARKTNNDNRDKISLILSRFHLHKARPSFAAALVLKLVCTKEEETILEKEQKLMKRFGLDLNATSQSAADSNNYQWALNPSASQWGWGAGFPSPQGVQGNFPFFRGAPRFVRPNGGRMRMFRPQTRPQLCYKCFKAGHFVKDCPLNI